MDYLVNITTDPYYYWQIELLIQSFRRHKLEDKLIIAVCNNEAEVYLPPLAQNHERKFVFPPHDESFHAINKIFSIYAAIHEKIISPSFVSIHPDMVLMNPDFQFEENIIFNTPEPDDGIKSKVCPYEDTPWITIDGATVFNNVPENFFLHALQNCKDLVGQVPKAKLGLAAWSKTMYQFIELLSYRGVPMEIILDQHEEVAPFVHYRLGMPPYFHKVNYKFFGVLDFADDPFTTLIENNPTSTTDYVRSIAEEYIKERAQ